MSRMTAAEYQRETKPKRPRVEREAKIQREIIAWLRENVTGEPLVFHVANQLDMAGPQAARQIAKAKFNGMMPGAPTW